jgi:hypothetical protein
VEVCELLLINPVRLELLADSTDERIIRYRDGLLAQADDIIETGKLYSVTDNAKIPPSGDKHDYYSTGPYWWPDPDSPDGLPYIQRDGEFNPERDLVSDRAPLNGMIHDSRVMAVAYAVTGEASYAEWGGRLLRHWFIDASTRMNPNLNHAQAIPGRTTGRGTGVIDTHPFAELVDAILILSESEELTRAELVQLRDWFSAYAQWLIDSPNGRDEQDSINNHGTAYDMQLAALLWFSGRNEDLARYVSEFSLARIERQITPDGLQPLELKRTRTWSYCTENLEHFFKLGLIARKVDIDLFTHCSPTGSNLKQALDYLLPFVCRPEGWPHQQKTEWQDYFINSVLSIASGVYKGARYDKALDCLEDADNAVFAFLLRP